MSQVDWRLGVMPDIAGNALAAYKQARVEKREEDGRAALSAYATNPDDPAAFAGLAKTNPQAAMQVRQSRDQAQRQRQEDRRADLPLMLKLLNHARKDPQSWQQSIATAQEYGIDTGNIPGQYDPQWAEQQIAQLQTLQDPKAQEALSTAGKIATDQLGQDKVGTPEWRQRVTEIWQSGESKPYVVGGETRLYTPKLGGQGQVYGAPQQGQRHAGSDDVFTVEMLQGALDSLGPEGTAQMLEKNGLVVSIHDDADYALLPPGTSFYDPNGNLRRKGN